MSICPWFFTLKFITAEVETTVWRKVVAELGLIYWAGDEADGWRLRNFNSSQQRKGVPCTHTHIHKNRQETNAGGTTKNPIDV